MKKLESKSAFISLGPTCLPAEILKASNLRICTYGFDWIRSGGFFVEKFFELPLDIFLNRYVIEPCIPLRQPCDPCSKQNKTVDLVNIDNPYGFPYLYTPHRDYSKTSTHSYLTRAFTRLHSILSCSNVRKTFLLADYSNKDGSVFLDDYVRITNFLNNLYSKNSSFKLDGSYTYILRLNLIQEGQGQKLTFRAIKDDCVSSNNITTRLIEATYPSSLDSEEVRHHIYRLIGSKLFC